MAKILGVRVDDIGGSEVLKIAKGFLEDDKQHTIFTPNPEMLVAAHKSEAFKDVLNKSSLNICDGRGIQLFGRLKNRVPGVEFMQGLCKLAENEGKSIYLLGSGSYDVLSKTKQELTVQHSNLRIVGMDPGPKLSTTGEGDSQNAISSINEAKPDILFVAFGHEKQEMWINTHLSELPSVKIAMGVGGSFDFISGNATRAPKWMRSLGLEWLFRLIRQPRRIKRIFTAVIVFPLLILKSKI